MSEQGSGGERGCEEDRGLRWGQPWGRGRRRGAWLEGGAGSGGGADRGVERKGGPPELWELGVAVLLLSVH